MSIDRFRLHGCHRATLTWPHAEDCSLYSRLRYSAVCDRAQRFTQDDVRVAGRARRASTASAVIGWIGRTELGDNQIRRRRQPTLDDLRAGRHGRRCTCAVRLRPEHEPVSGSHAYRPPDLVCHCRTAARIPRRISIGGGGHPAMVASTGITLLTLPQLA